MKQTYPKKDLSINKKLADSGVHFIDIDNTYIGEKVEIGTNCVIYPNVCIWDNVKIGNNCTIQTSTIITNNIKIFNDVFIGPGCLIRDNSVIANNCSIGPNCEITRSFLGVNCILGHKNFIGDAVLEDNVKFGAGAIIANSNWKDTFKATIGKNTLIGVNSCLISPIKIGNDCIVAAGSTITDSCGDNQLLIARTRQITKDRK